MDEVGFVNMVMTGNFEKSLKIFTDNIVISNCIKLYNIFRSIGFINKNPDFFNYVNKLLKNKDIYRDIYGLIQNVIVIRKLNIEELKKLLNILEQYRKLGSHEKYYFTNGELVLTNKNYFILNDKKFQEEMMKNLNSISFRFPYSYNLDNVVSDQEGYKIPIIIIINCE